eukprot:5116128-Amphidinium_carterae.1
MLVTTRLVARGCVCCSRWQIKVALVRRGLCSPHKRLPRGCTVHLSSRGFHAWAGTVPRPALSDAARAPDGGGARIGNDSFEI